MIERDGRVLDGQVAIVTGASSGLGRATAIALAQAGADVALLARSARDLAEAVTDVEAFGRRGLALPVDLAREEEILQAIERTRATFGRIDVLVNAAGTDVPGAIATHCRPGGIGRLPLSPNSAA